MTSRLVGILVAVLMLNAGCSSGPTDEAGMQRSPTPAATGTSGAMQGGPSLGLPRAVHRATTLTDGRVLLTGGCSEPGCEGVGAAATTAVFDPLRRRVTVGPRLRQPRISHTATLLADGRVLLVGGYPGEGLPATASMEVYDPVSGSLTSAGELREPRADHTSTLLRDGSVLVAGGRGPTGEVLGTYERVDAGRGRPVAGGVLPEPRAAHTATLTAGRVLLVGGAGAGGTALPSTVLLDPMTGRAGPGPVSLLGRVKHATVALPDGGVLVIGGSADTSSERRLDDTELLEQGSGRFRPGPDLPDGRYKLADAAAVLEDGRVVVGGGPSLAVLDAAAGTTATLGTDLDGRRSFQSVNLLGDGRVLVAGGYDDDIRPTARTWVLDLES